MGPSRTAARRVDRPTGPGLAEGPTKKTSGLRIPGFAQLQRLGKSLMLPIALLPAAGILLRLGQPDLLGGIKTPVIGPFFEAMSAAGGAVFANLPLLFAIGVAIGFAKKADGSTALAAAAGYLVIEAVFKAMSPVVLDGVLDQAGEQAQINYSVFAGILVGLLTALLFDRYHTIALPSYLGFFGGRRFVPIVVSVTSLVLGFGLSYFYPIFNVGLTGVGQFIGGSGALGAFTYGFANRMLIPVGLHHILNTYVWFLFGDYQVPSGAVVTGELTRFAAGDPTAGLLTAGFYPILMFGLPAAALAMIHMADKKQKKIAVGILGAAAITAFLTGVTEPLEFAFMFVAFPLYVVHAVLTGLSLAIAYLLDIHLGFSFSAGLIDLLLYGSAPAAKNVWLLIVMGLVFFVVYYVLFRLAIRWWNLRTPGREPRDEFEAEQAANLEDEHGVLVPGGGADSKAERLIAAFGGRENLVNVDACITRLRMEVVDRDQVDKARLKALGAAGVIEVGNNVQAVFGTQAEILKGEITDAMAGPTPVVVDTPAPVSTPATPAPAKPTEAGSAGGTEVLAPVRGRAVPMRQVPDPTFADGLVGPGAAIDPPHEIVDAVAPISGTVLQMFPHAYVIVSADSIGVLVHLGLDTVQLKGEGFTAHVAKGDTVEAGQPIMTYDVPSVVATGRNPIVPVVVMEKQPQDIRLDDVIAAGGELTTAQPIIAVTH
ncbi:glucose PTS transporter subunit IIA [Pseudonocardia charpentierae]|uniref:Glucose PTS transporter subunit IIA n=1 Tax=Pseudonocardia charpentierae TaxID=3075545 RepID=A0ABU2NI06_9PSEU|nr:glucose PTS transporter subunit IIA [Pseudonocardia sp. DSM 45834]MDT0353585.1 glucose PTS transporter subunit IIA [Pseudonocardia sp. DSM 45834]